jgi:hypothetical protein
MNDLVVVILTFAFFALAGLLVVACERIVNTAEGATK